MKRKINTAPLTLLVVIGGSIFIAFFISRTPPNLPITVFSIACTILLASLALPSLLGISESKVVRGLFFILYNNFVHILFPVYQLILAVVALIAEYSKSNDNIPAFFSRILLVLIIFDLFYILYYLSYLIGLIASPLKMLGAFENRILSKIKRDIKKGNEKKILSEIQILVKISRDTGMGEEKYTSLKIFQKLLKEVTQSTQKDKNIPAELQYKLWKLLVENIYEVCQNNNDLYSANDRNVSKAVDILKKSFQGINHWSKSGFDYAVCTRTLKRIADFAIKKGYNDSLNKAVSVLGEIGEQSISDQPTPRVSPVEIASDMADLGIAAVQLGKDDLTDQFIVHLLNFYSISKKETYLFYTLNLMSFVWDNNNDALEELGNRLCGLFKSEIDEAVKYGAICFQRETVRIKRFLAAVGKIKDPGFFASFKKLLWL
jgi:hypothetical protein